MSGLYLEGADWDIERGCLTKSKPKVLVVDLPVLKIIPIEAHRLKLQVGAASFPAPGLQFPSLPSPGAGQLRGVVPAWRHCPGRCTHTCAQTAGGTFRVRSWARQPQETPGHS